MAAVAGIRGQATFGNYKTLSNAGNSVDRRGVAWIAATTSLAP
jgi:hypothetical protein